MSSFLPFSSFASPSSVAIRLDACFKYGRSAFAGRGPEYFCAVANAAIHSTIQTTRISLLSPPLLQNLFHLTRHLEPREFAVHAFCWKLVISRAIVTNRSPHRSDQRLFLQIASRLRSPHTPASPRRRVPRDRGRFVCRDSREQIADPLGHPGHEFAIVFLPCDRRGHACGGPRVRILRALVLRFLKRRRLHQDSLSLITSARPAEPHDHSRPPTILRRAACQRRVARAQILQTVHVRAGQA